MGSAAAFALRSATAFLILALAACSGGSGGSQPLGCDEECHGLPPSGGAHATHDQSQLLGGVSVGCDVCHGEGAASGTHPGHQDTDVTLLGSSGYTAQHGTLPSWFASTWGGAGYYGTPSAETGPSEGEATCARVRCHGGGSVSWAEQADSPYFNAVCLGCHDLTRSEFQLPGDPLVHRASDAAANYAGPVSGWGRGGHGDLAINDPEWFRECATEASVPLACVRCHDPGSPHHPVDAANPYRVLQAALSNTLPGALPYLTRVTNLCTQDGCHPKELGEIAHAFLTSPKHPSDRWPLASPAAVVVGSPYPVLDQSAASTTSDPHYDPAGVAPAVGTHIDRFVDHWGWWDPAAPATAGSADDRPFLPLGDSLAKGGGDAFDNDAATLVTCITCHNPHGTDLRVGGRRPFVPDAQAMVPENKMLRLRDSDNELCLACHR